MVSLVGAQHQRTLGSRIRPIFITDDNEVKIKPELRKKLLATSGINQDASIVSVRMQSRFLAHPYYMREPKGELEALLTGEFFDTDNFYVHTPQDFADLDRLTNEMTDLYKKEPSYNVLKCQPMIGTAVAAFDGETNTWLRAEVIDVD